MNKGNIMFGVFGLAVGLIVGFTCANSINKGDLGKVGAQSTSVTAPAGNPAMPADHPPLGTSSGDATQTAPVAQVMESIEKAKQQPQNYEAQMTAADLYYQIQRFDDAAKFYEAAVKLKPNDAEPLIKAGNAYFDAEKYEIAEKWYTQALEKDPKNLAVRTDLGLTFFLRTPRDVDRAIKEYNVSLGIDANNEVTLQNLVLAYREKGDQEKLQATLEKLKKINPNNPAVTKTENAL